MGTHMTVLRESLLMNTNMTGFRWFLKSLCIRVLCTKVASAMGGLGEEVCLSILLDIDSLCIRYLLLWVLCSQIMNHVLHKAV